MAYTPPAENAILVDLASGAGTYTPPVSTSIVVDLATEDGVSGQVDFVNVYGSLHATGYGPKSVYAQSVGYGSVSISFPPPAFHTTKTDTLSAAGVVEVTPLAPTYGSSKVSGIDAFDSIFIDFIEPTYFKGITQKIAEIGSISVAAYADITHTRNSHTDVPAAPIVVSTPAITHRVLHTLSGSAPMVVHGQAGIRQVQKIRNFIDAKYYTPDITIDAPGGVSIAAFAPTTSMLVRSSVQVTYGVTQRLVTSLVGKYTARVASETTSLHAIRGRVVKEYAGQYGLLPYDKVYSQIVAPYRLPITAAVHAAYALIANVRVSSAISADYALIRNTKVRASLDSAYAVVSNIKVRKEVSSYYRLVQNQKISNLIDSRYGIVQALRAIAFTDSKYSYAHMLRKAVVGRYHLTASLKVDTSAYYDIESSRKVRSYISGIYSLPVSQVISITTAPYLEYEGQRFGVAEAEISIAEEDYAWKSTIVLTHVTDYAKIKQDKPFTLVIGTESYLFIVDSKELDRGNPANYAAKLLGISPSAKIETPRHDAVTYLWDTFVQAADVAAEVIPGIDWRVLDWGIPAYRLAAQDSSPIGIVRTLASAIGAVVESDLDGSLYVRSRYPVSVPNYYTSTPAHIFVEATDILTVSESYVSMDVFNRLVITDVSNDISDSLEWTPDYSEATTGVMRAFLYPWRSAVSLVHTGLPGVVIGSPNLGMAQHTEIIEVFQGQGQTEYPIHHVDTVDYEASNVGSLVFDVDSRSFTVAGPAFNSVIRLVYWTRSLDYRVSLPQTRPTQFLLESAPL